MNKRFFSSLSIAAITAAIALSVFSFAPVKAEAAGKAGDYNGAFRWALVKSLLRLRKA